MMKIRRHVALLVIAAFMLAAGCGEKTEITQAPGCQPTMTSTGKKEKVADSVKPTSCKGVVLMCNYCQYKPDGTFSNSGFEPCGACIGADF